MDARNKLQNEINAATILREHLKEVLPEDGLDAQTLLDMVEGETNLLELLRKVVAQIGIDEASVEGVKTFVSTLEARADRIKKRAGMMRAMVLNALDIIEQKQLDLAIATVSKRPTPRAVVVTNEVAIPRRFWKTLEPTLMKKELGDALKAGETVEGAQLDNGGVTVQIKFS